MSSAQRSSKPSDTSFGVSEYSLDRDFSFQSETGSAVSGAAAKEEKPDHDKSVRRFRPDDAGIVEAVKTLIAAAPGNFKSVMIDGSKHADEHGEWSYYGRVAIDDGTMTTAQPEVEMRRQGKAFVYSMSVLRGYDETAATRRTTSLVKLLTPLVGEDADAGEPTEFAGIVHYDITNGFKNPVLRIQQLGGAVKVFVYRDALELRTE